MICFICEWLSMDVGCLALDFYYMQDHYCLLNSRYITQTEAYIAYNFPHGGFGWVCELSRGQHRRIGSQ